MESTTNSPTISRRSSVTNLAHTFVSDKTMPKYMEEVQKACMNFDLINAFKSTSRPGIQPYITGVGLYTHAECPSNVSVSLQRDGLPQKPRFLSISRHFESKDSGPKLPKKVHKVWESLRDIMKVEEEAIGRLELELEYLKQMYGGLPVPESSMFLAQSESEETLMQREEHRRGTVVTEVATELQSTTRRSSDVVAADVSEVDNVNIQGAEEKREENPFKYADIPPGSEKAKMII